MAREIVAVQRGGIVVPVEVVCGPREVTGSVDARLESQLAGTLWMPPGISDEERARRISAAVAALRGLAPRDELEGMRAAQMVATHCAAMECLARAVQRGRDARGIGWWLRQAGRLLALFAEQVETFDRTRAGGQPGSPVGTVPPGPGGGPTAGPAAAPGAHAG